MKTDSRPEKLVLGRHTLSVPVFFPSISTVKTTLTLFEYLKILVSLREINQQFLLSAFDLDRSCSDAGVEQWLKAAHEAGTTMLMDSGNYESYWKSQTASWQQADFHDVLRRFPCAVVLGFDEQDPPKNLDVHVELVVERWRRDQSASGTRVVVPIVHGTSDSLPRLCTRIAKETQAPMVAVPERRLGSGIFERTRAVTALRHALNGLGRYVGLHLLGTGNPISIALYACAGADSFDGLEWCQTVVDHDTGLLFHLSQSDFFRRQTEWGDEDLSFHSRTLAHNLAFYTDWMLRLRQAIHSDDAPRFCRFNFPPNVYRQCIEASVLGPTV